MLQNVSLVLFRIYQMSIIPKDNGLVFPNMPTARPKQGLNSSPLCLADELWGTKLDSYKQNYHE